MAWVRYTQVDWIDIYFALWGDGKLVGRVGLVAKQHDGSSVLVPAAACNGGTRAARGAAEVGVAAAGNTWPSTTSWQTMGLPGSLQVSKRRCPGGPPRTTAVSLAENIGLDFRLREPRIREADIF